MKRTIWSLFHRKIAGESPEEITSSKQYGTELKATVLSLFTVGYMSVNRIKEFLNGFQIPISTGTIQNILSGCVGLMRLFPC